jgi:hypothetical protein
MDDPNRLARSLVDAMHSELLRKSQRNAGLGFT